MPSKHLALLPRDGVFFKDGRGWYTSGSGRGRALGWPFPTTLLGAARTAFGLALERTLNKSFGRADWLRETEHLALGASLALRRPLGGGSWSTEERMWPVPADALYLEESETVHRLQPRKSVVTTLGTNDDEARESLFRPVFPEQRKPLPPPRFWPERDFAAWLRGEPVAHHKHFQALAPLARVDSHVAIDADTQTAADSLLYSNDTVEMASSEGDCRYEWGLGVAIDLPVDATLTQPWTLGSDRRMAAAEEVSPDLFALPKGHMIGDSAGLRIVLATPALFKAGWLPDGFEARDGEYVGAVAGVAGTLVLRAAFVTRAAHVSGWNMHAGRPKDTMCLAPAGSVYFVEKVDGMAFSRAEIDALWLSPWGMETNQGLGRVVAGGWTPEKQG